MQRWFGRFARHTAEWTGTPWSFAIAVTVILVWAVTGPVFGFSDTWQLVINTGTTIVTFLMVFLIQNTQNRDSKAMHLKLDELLRGVKGARTGLVDLEDASDEEMDELQREFARIRELRKSSPDLVAREARELGDAAEAEARRSGLSEHESRRVGERIAESAKHDAG
jgi:low affinity Fe/Cu permease